MHNDFFNLGERYCEGKGVDVSKEHRLKNALHCYIEPGNLYLLSKQVGVETQDYLFAYNIINATKYFRILLYEWFLTIKEKGYLLIYLQENDLLSAASLKKEIDILQLYKDKYQIIEEHQNDRRYFFVIQKLKSVKIPGDSIEKWTFGLVTNGRRKEFIQKSIQSIRALQIPHYEIIICGTYYGSTASDIKYIHFAQQDDKGWITKKKNIICQHAQYENIVIIHDRIYFDKNWFLGMKKWGNYFDVLSCPIVLPTRRFAFTNWETVGPNWKKEDDTKMLHKNAQLHPSDWDENVYVGGAFIALKKRIWSIEKWNESLFWGEAEDIEYSLRQHKRGILIRFNPYARVHSFVASGLTFIKAFRERNPKELGKYKSNLFVVLLLKFLDFIGLRRNQRGVIFFVSLLKRLNKVSDWRMEKRDG